MAGELVVAGGRQAWSRAGEQPAKLEFLELEQKQKQSKTHHSEWLCFYCRCFKLFRGETALMVLEICVWFDQVRYFRLLQCCVTTMCPPLIKWDTLNWLSLSRYNEQS